MSALHFNNRDCASSSSAVLYVKCFSKAASAPQGASVPACQHISGQLPASMFIDGQGFVCMKTHLEHSQPFPYSRRACKSA